ncbi:hypothetical protein GobsT_32980 [Gemmata obscuriglobus]|uniref:Uncharacterized protein n=1 Tax=Gemmata obscuriglobus TaxID=114 RepID=A0A2Z3H101_9BACT|nr:hypothetical protein [Gemmata obscuriglobus]AWM38531.1 hypothetical protein C1280_17110 [Gemmata obscuriglobus]QEG28518.1 hypothetical protein GobsT_32980 [Gemmata obscuriglobus]VTS06576.1 Uncharacterized protein OS=Rhodonellum psychrophilum GCM71 = DSM 17998 GN=P872_09920 PE=4 SV=1 [Gemmata obscuriglobus UQM 2246]
MELLQNSFYLFEAIRPLAAAAGAVGQFLRQPLIVVFIVVGIGIGPAGLGLTRLGEGIGQGQRVLIAL